MNKGWLHVRGQERGHGGRERRRVMRLGERGQGMLEYAIICGAIIVGTVAVLAGLSGSLTHIFSQISTTLSQY